MPSLDPGVLRIGQEEASTLLQLRVEGVTVERPTGERGAGHRGAVDGEVDSRIAEEGAQQVVLDLVQRQLVAGHTVAHGGPHAVDLPDRGDPGMPQNRSDGQGVVGVDQKGLEMGWAEVGGVRRGHFGQIGIQLADMVLEVRVVDETVPRALGEQSIPGAVIEGPRASF
jgi:hypothetical protein